jgi:hypothetical protein
VEDFVMVRQHCSPVTVAFEDDAVAEFFDQQTDAGRRPEQFARIMWCRTLCGVAFIRLSVLLSGLVRTPHNFIRIPATPGCLDRTDSWFSRPRLFRPGMLPRLLLS